MPGMRTRAARPDGRRPLSVGCTESWSDCLGRGVVSTGDVAVAAGRDRIGEVRSGGRVARVGDVIGQSLLNGAQLVADAGEEGQVASGFAARAGGVPVSAPGALTLAFSHRLLIRGDDRA